MSFGHGLNGHHFNSVGQHVLHKHHPTSEAMYNLNEQIIKSSVEIPTWVIRWSPKYENSSKVSHLSTVHWFKIKNFKRPCLECRFDWTRGKPKIWCFIVRHSFPRFLSIINQAKSVVLAIFGDSYIIWYCWLYFHWMVNPLSFSDLVKYHIDPVISYAYQNVWLSNPIQANPI